MFVVAELGECVFYSRYIDTDRPSFYLCEVFDAHNLLLSQVPDTDSQPKILRCMREIYSCEVASIAAFVLVLIEPNFL